MSKINRTMTHKQVELHDNKMIELEKLIDEGEITSEKALKLLANFDRKMFEAVFD